MREFQITRRRFAAGAAASLVLAPGASANPEAGKSGGKPERGGGGDLNIDMMLQFLPLNVVQRAIYYIAALVIITGGPFIYSFTRNGVLRRLENRLNTSFIPFLGGLTRATYSKADFAPETVAGAVYLHNPTTLLIDMRDYDDEDGPPSPLAEALRRGGPINVPSGASTPYSATAIDNTRGAPQVSLEARLQEVDRTALNDLGVSFDVERAKAGGIRFSSLVTFNDDFSYVSSGKQFYSAFTPFEIAFHNQTRDAPAKSRRIPFLTELPLMGQLIGRAHLSSKEPQSLFISVKPSVVAGYE